MLRRVQQAICGHDAVQTRASHPVMQCPLASLDVDKLSAAEDLEGNRVEYEYTGDNLTLADFSVASMADYLDAAEVPYHPYSNISAWLKRMEEIPAWAETPKLAA